MERFERVVKLVMQELGQNYLRDAGDPFKFALAITKRATSASPNPGGMKYELIGGASHGQARAILNTSTDDAEAARRLIDLIIHKKDTTVTRNSSDDIFDRVMQAVDVKMDSIIKLLQGSVRAAEAASDPCEPQGIQGKRKPNTQEARKKHGDEIALWTERAKQIGMPVRLTKDQKKLDGRWLRTASRLWEAHVGQ